MLIEILCSCQVTIPPFALIWYVCVICIIIFWSDPAVTALVLQAIGDPKTKDDTDTAYLEEAIDEADGKYTECPIYGAPN